MSLAITKQKFLKDYKRKCLFILFPSQFKCQGCRHSSLWQLVLQSSRESSSKPGTSGWFSAVSDLSLADDQKQMSFPGLALASEQACML